MVNEISNKALMPSQPQAKSNVVELKPVKPDTSEDPVDSSEVLTSLMTVDQTADSEEMENTANRLNEIVQDIRRDLEFKVDDNSGDMVITVLDKETKEVIRQIPQEHVLALRENMESLKGILFSAEI